MKSNNQSENKSIAYEWVITSKEETAPYDDKTFRTYLRQMYETRDRNLINKSFARQGGEKPAVNLKPE